MVIVVIMLPLPGIAFVAKQELKVQTKPLRISQLPLTHSKTPILFLRVPYYDCTYIPQTLLDRLNTDG